ncbi:MAG TPA: tetraacyldisaccharide 4'-kinase [Bradyrhizobium sp.]|nr:tetraacyldisaccharide 4'-kinase [Bradyrhizobium sp.]
MASDAPPFWWDKPDWRAYALLPVSVLYGAVTRRRMHAAGRAKIDLPVLCIGNLTVGGAGKTPVAIALAQTAAMLDLKPGFLSRGYGGSLTGPHLVNPRHDSAKHVGDEPLLLAEHAPVAVTPNRALGAKLLAEQGCEFLIMDDGFQSARLHFDYALLVVDARRGIGNGHVIPGGPMRAPLLDQLRLADAVLKMGEGDAADLVIRRAARAGKPIFEAAARARLKNGIAGKRFLAFAGIGNPQKFSDTVGAAGGAVAMTRSFGDHHFYQDDELADLRTLAEAEELEIITTAKDAVRLRHGSPAAQTLLDRLHVLQIDAVFEPHQTAERIIRDTLGNWRERRIGA